MVWEDVSIEWRYMNQCLQECPEANTVYYRVTVPFKSKPVLAEAPYPYNDGAGLRKAVMFRLLLREGR